MLLSPSLLEEYLEFAGKLLKYFVEVFAGLYGVDQCVYNVHSLTQIADDACHFGILDNVSSFK